MEVVVFLVDPEVDLFGDLSCSDPVPVDLRVVYFSPSAPVVDFLVVFFSPPVPVVEVDFLVVFFSPSEVVEAGFLIVSDCL